jgi:rRNA maturation endonuclease Nob1
MLKVKVDQGQDYFDYLIPFVLQVLVDHKPDPITDRIISRYISSDFGLIIPQRAIQIILKRISRAYPLKRESGVFHITGHIPDPNISVKKSEANLHIQAVISGLQEFAERSGHSINKNAATNAVLGFLSEFNIPCLRAYLRGTAIPSVKGDKQANIILVSDYVLHLQKTDPERFGSFMILVQGHMLANALLCPDLVNAPKSYNNVSFYFDTPLLIQLLGLEGEFKERAAKELVEQLLNLGGTVKAFAHSRDELDRVLKGAADFVDSPRGRGTVIMEARRSGTTKSDLLFLAIKAEELLAEIGVKIEETPPYIERYQIDEIAFGDILEDEVAYYNPRAREYDINSVRSIYALRSDLKPTSVENCKAVMVSSNSGFSKAAYEYGQSQSASREVSSVITDFSLANMAWLKAPMGAPSIPMMELTAFSYAALRPSKELLSKFLDEVDKLQKFGKISENDHRLLRSSVLAHGELVSLTLGDEAALTEETISKTLRRVVDELKKEELEKIKREQEAHHKTKVKSAEEIEQERQAHKTTQEELQKLSDENNTIKKKIYWNRSRQAKRYAQIICCILVAIIIIGVVASTGLRSHNYYIAFAIWVCVAILTLLTVLNLLFGTTVEKLYEMLRSKILWWLLRRETITTGITFGELND